METKRSVEEIEPLCKWRKEEQQDVLEVHIQGFKKEQVRVQINNLGVLTITGERPVDQKKMVCFSKEIKVSKDCKREEIQAKFSGGILYVTMPKRIPLLMMLPIPNQQTGNAEDPNINSIDNKTGGGGGGGRIGTSATLQSRRWLQPMSGKTALKLGALAAVMVVAAVGAYVAYKAFHVED